MDAHGEVATTERAATRWWTQAHSLCLVMIAACAGVFVASHLKQDLTRNDFERFDDLRLLSLFFVLFVGLCAAYIALYRERPRLTHRLTMGTSLACIALLLFSFPVGAKDLFAYALLGRIWNFYGANPYVAAPAQFPNDPWQIFQSGQPFSIYGPLFLWQTWIVDVAGRQSIWLVIWLHKAVAAVALLVSLRVAERLLRESAGTADDADTTWRMALLALNPLLLFECASGGHNDIIMVLLLLAALRSQHRGRFILSVALLAVSFWYKWYSLIFLPPFFIATARAAGLRAAARQAACCTLALGAVAVLALAPLPGSMPAIIGEWLHPQKMNGIYPNELPPPLAALFWALRAGGAFASDYGFRLFDLIRYALFALTTAGLLIRQWLAPPTRDTLTESCCLVGVAAFFLLITQLWPWHLMTVIALATLCEREALRLTGVTVTVIGALSYFLTFGVATLMLVAIAATLWVLRRLGLSGTHAVELRVARST